MGLHQWKADDGLAKRQPILGVCPRNGQGTAAVGGTANRIVNARGVDDVLESILKTADMVAERIPKIEFGRGHRTRAQLVFEAANGEVVNLAVLEVARHEEQPQPTCAFFVPHAGSH